MNKLIILVFFSSVVAAVLAEQVEEHRRYKRSGIKIVRDYSGCKCTGSEKNARGGKGPRYFDVRCGKSGSASDCSYKGNPHPCKDYPKKAMNFYSELLDAVAPGQCGLLTGRNKCPSGSTFHTRSTCSTVTYTCE